MAIAQIKVAPFRTVVARKEVFGGFHLQMLYCDCNDTPYEWIGHPAVFATQERAEKFLAQVMAGKINQRAWGKSQAAYGVI